mmetsp:Transcript_7796/g.9381  ORF Transcript_7796/g.9381 Transcript_7796/m.9381 type:complete len:207 (+) Transcript_7796:1-621(+)
MALSAGFCSIEADIWMEKETSGKKLVLGHLRPGKLSLKKTYLVPLIERTLGYSENVNENGEEVGTDVHIHPVYRQSRTLGIPCEQITLLVDLKFYLISQYSPYEIWSVLDDMLLRLNAEYNASVFQCYNKTSNKKLTDSKSMLQGNLAPIEVVVSGVPDDQIPTFAKVSFLLGVAGTYLNHNSTANGRQTHTLFNSRRQGSKLRQC